MNELSDCKKCTNRSCLGECDALITGMALAMNGGGRSSFDEKVLAMIPKFKYILNGKIANIFGTDFIVSKNSNESTKETEEFNSWIYSINKNNRTNLKEIKLAEREKQIYGKAYLFYDNENVYHLDFKSVSEFYDKEAEEDPISNEITYYKVGKGRLEKDIEINEEEGYKKLDKTYYILPSNMIVLQQEDYFLNSNLKEIDVLLNINDRIAESTTLRDYGDIFLLTNKVSRNLVSAVENVSKKVKDSVNESIKRMRQAIADKLKKNKTEDSNVVVLDSDYQDVKQVKPVTKITDYEFYWKDRDEIVADAFNYPTVLVSLGENSGNISKDSIIKQARADFLTPLKEELANQLTKIARLKFGEEFYVHFADYEEIE